MEQILVNTGATLEIVFSVGDADGDVLITITRGDGSAVVTDAVTSSAGAGRYTYALAPQPAVDALTVLWEGTFGGVAQSVTSYAEIVGAYLFLLSEARAHGDSVLADNTVYPDAVIREKRAELSQFFENVCDVSFVPRYQREVLDGPGWARLRLARRRVRALLAASVDNVALTSPELADVDVYESGTLLREAFWPAGRRNIAVSYEYGWPAPPERIKRAALVLARYELVQRDVSERMVTFSNELGTVRLSVPGRKNPTGIPVVDAALADHDEHLPLYA